MFVLVMFEYCLVGISVFLFTFFLIFKRPFHDNVALTIYILEYINALVQRNTVSFGLTRHWIHNI